MVILYMVSHGRQVASVAGLATICASCNKQHSKGNHAAFIPVLSGYIVMIIMSFLLLLLKVLLPPLSLSPDER